MREIYDYAMYYQDLFSNYYDYFSEEVYMAIIFVIFTVALLCSILHQRMIAIALAIVGLFACLLMLWHHASDILMINL